jgi:hypothetical protein
MAALPPFTTKKEHCDRSVGMVANFVPRQNSIGSCRRATSRSHEDTQSMSLLGVKRTWLFLRCTCLLMAQSRHGLSHCTCPLSGGKADITIAACPLLRSLLGVKRTWLVAAHMSAFDPKRTLLLRCGISAFGPKRTSLVAPHTSAFGGKADIDQPGRLTNLDL